MRTELTQHELDFYRENGFLTVPDFLDDDDLSTWRDAVESGVLERGGRMFPGPTLFEQEHEERLKAMSEEDAEFTRMIFTQHVNLWQTSEAMRRLILDERLGKLAADLAGVDGIRIWHDQLLTKQPYASYTAFHQDNPAWSFTSRDSIQIWIALDDATLENGCMYYVPGTHNAPKLEDRGVDRSKRAISHGVGALFDYYPEWRHIVPIPCPVRAGGACFHNGLTAHGAGVNMTPGLRRAMTCAYMPDGSTFNGVPNVLPPTYLATLSPGDILDDDQHNPLIFRRTGNLTGSPR